MPIAPATALDGGVEMWATLLWQDYDASCRSRRDGCMFWLAEVDISPCF